MPNLSRYFKITKVKIDDPYSLINYEIIYASHTWKRTMRIDMRKIENFTYEQLRRRVRVEAMGLINQRAGIENNLRRIEKMIGEERAF